MQVSKDEKSTSFKREITIGSLFDGSGGFPLAGALNGAAPLWASEIEPYPIAVTRSRFPNMKHLGSVTDIHGGDIEPVDIITFGSPCQDMSVAGKRAGMQHSSKGDDDTTRSGLFFEAIRIIKEMKVKTNGEYPKFAIWENVPGAFTSNKGEDFKCVLEELFSISEEKELSIPKPDSGKWPNSGEIVGDRGSLAWRVLDAQYWGVPQRRRRIYLVADFAAGRAGKILFERESMSGHFAPCGEAREGAAADAERGADRGGQPWCMNPWDSQSERIYSTDEPFPTLSANASGGQNRQGVCYLQSQSELPIYSIDQQGGKGVASYSEDVNCTLCSDSHGTPHAVCYTMQGNGIDCRQNVMALDCRNLCANSISATLQAKENGGYSLNFQNPVIYDTTQITSPMNYSNPKVGDPCHPLAAKQHPPLVVCDTRRNGDGQNIPTLIGNHENRITDYTAICCQNTGRGWWNQGEIAETLRTPCGGDSIKANLVVCSATGQANAEIMENMSPTLVAGHEHPIVAHESKLFRRYIVRRLTPTECARLQGFPDCWGVPDHKEEMSEDELSFWHNVRDIYATANGKKYKKAKDDALLKWYNKLHTDSAEYKMWGNGIALPCAEYVVGGVVEAIANG